MKIAILCLLLPFSALAAIQKPQEVVQDIFAKASAPEIANSAAKQSEVNGAVDFSALAKGALGKNFKTTPAKDFEWFRATLQEIIARTVYPKAPEFLNGVKINYEAVKENGNGATVKSTVQNKADLTDVEYRLQKGSDGSWRVVDVSISGISWVDSIRDQVSDVLKKKKWQGLKDAMSRRLADLKAGKA
ncbi:MAG: phospholipid-binding protein MlaC [Bacteriovoracia bacterium]